MTTANTTTATKFATLAGIVRITAKGRVSKDGAFVGRIMPNPDAEAGVAEYGYVTVAGDESPSWFVDMCQSDEDPDLVTMPARERAVRALASRVSNEPRTGGRGTVGRGNPSKRLPLVAALVSRDNGATRAQILAAIARKAGAPMGEHLVPNLVSAVRRRYNLTITLDRATGSYIAA